VDLVILETGLGGRLDATTAAGAQIVGITPIAMDHEEYLGETIESIAAEKAAIIRPGVTAVVGPQPAEALRVILRHSDAGGVKPRVHDCRADVQEIAADGRIKVTFRTSQDRYENVWLGLRGRHQIENACVALQLAESLCERGFAVDRAAMIEGLGTAQHKGRLELQAGQPSFLFDGAHNPSGALALFRYLREFVHVPVTIIFGAMDEKKIGKMAELLFLVADRVILTVPENPRAASLEKLRRESLRVVGSDRITTASSVRDAIAKALELTPKGGLICITGSLYLVGEAQTVMSENTGQKFATAHTAR
jgi:dihydrofolate synthase / folylpolyglutamate synthase